MYYCLKSELDDKIIGIYPQIQEFAGIINENPYPGFDPETGRFPDEMEFPIYRMHVKAKLTDYIENVPLGGDKMLISNRLYKFFCRFKMAEHQVFPGQFIRVKGLYKDYKILFFVRKQEYKDCIIWNKSFFYKTRNWHKDIIEKITFKNWNDMWHKKKLIEDLGFGIKNGDIYIKKECMHYDLIHFGIYPAPNCFLVSEKLKKSIEENGFTGMRFEIKEIKLS